MPLCTVTVERGAAAGGERRDSEQPHEQRRDADGAEKTPSLLHSPRACRIGEACCRTAAMLERRVVAALVTILAPTDERTTATSWFDPSRSVRRR
jgi:hypothetical protein